MRWVHRPLWDGNMHKRIEISLTRFISVQIAMYECVTTYINSYQIVLK